LVTISDNLHAQAYLYLLFRWTFLIGDKGLYEVNRDV
jgi:hypothetical protein